MMEEGLPAPASMEEVDPMQPCRRRSAGGLPAPAKWSLPIPWRTMSTSHRPSSSNASRLQQHLSPPRRRRDSDEQHHP